MKEILKALVINAICDAKSMELEYRENIPDIIKIRINILHRKAKLLEQEIKKIEEEK